MCRLLGVVSSSTQNLNSLLGDDLTAFANLSSHHCDGWGVAYWSDDDNLTVCKEPVAACESALFRETVNTIETDAALLHLRKASDGMDNTEANTHPFLVGSMAFAHNGWAYPPEVLDELVTSVNGLRPQGTTDSERYFSLVLSATHHGDPVTALVEAADQIAARAQYESLNCLLLTHTALYAYARYVENEVTAARGPLSQYPLRFRVTGDAVMVASTGWDQPAPEWESLANGQILEVRRSDLRTSIHRRVLTRA
jgi:predicted glutamine amidotransferase